MPTRITHEPDPPKSKSGASGPKLKKPTSSIPVANSAGRDAVQSANNQRNTATQNGTAAVLQSSESGLQWASEPVNFLNAYRTANRLDIAGSFHSTSAALILSAPGIGRSSPTMVTRRNKQKKRIEKERLAQVVRKHFNDAPISETEVMATFVYVAKTQHQTFKARFGPVTKCTSREVVPPIKK